MGNSSSPRKCQMKFWISIGSQLSRGGGREMVGDGVQYSDYCQMLLSIPLRGKNKKLFSLICFGVEMACNPQQKTVTAMFIVHRTHNNKINLFFSIKNIHKE